MKQRNSLKVVAKVFKKDRWYVTLEEPYHSRKKTIPNAIYVWLKENPAFIDIPKNYVVHHLDWDPLNDDISNLVIMQKNHHIAHHFKNRQVKTKVKIDKKSLLKDFFIPVKKPSVNIYPQYNCFLVSVPERGSDGKIKRRYIYTHNGKRFETREMAEKFCDEIWKKFGPQKQTEHPEYTRS